MCEGECSLFLIEVNTLVLMTKKSEANLGSAQVTPINVPELVS